MADIAMIIRSGKRLLAAVTPLPVEAFSSDWGDKDGFMRSTQFQPREGPPVHA
jgi:hypothetical protein